MLKNLKVHVRWLTLAKLDLEKCQAQFGLLTKREFRKLRQALEHTNCSCPLPSGLQKHRIRMKKPRCGHQHVSVKKFILELIMKMTVYVCFSLKSLFHPKL